MGLRSDFLNGTHPSNLKIHKMARLLEDASPQQSKSLLANRWFRPGLRPEAPQHPPGRLRRRGEAAQTPSRDATGNSMTDALEAPLLALPKLDRRSRMST